MTRPSVRTSVIWSLGATYVAFAVQFAVSVVVSRWYLSPADFGLFSIALSAAMLVAVLQDFGMTRYIAGQAHLTDDDLAICFSVSLVLALVVTAVVLTLAVPVARFYDQPALAPILAIIAASYLALPIGLIPNALLARDMRFRALFVVNAGSALIGGAMTLILAARGFGAFALAWAIVAQSLTRALLGLWRSAVRPRFSRRLQSARPILRFGAASSALFVSGSLGTRTPELIIGRLLGIAAVGLYGRASGVAVQLHTLMAGAVGNVFYPAFRRLRDEGQPLDAPYLRVVAAYSGVVWPAMAALAVVAHPLVVMLYGDRWAGVGPLLRWIALTEIVFVALPLHIEIPILIGRIATLIRYNLLDTAASLILLVLAARFGLEAAAQSRLAYGGVWFLIYAGLMRRATGFAWPAMLRVYAGSAALTLAAIAPLLVASALGMLEPHFGTLIVAAAIGAGCWLVMVFALRHPLGVELHDMITNLLAKSTSNRNAEPVR